MEDKEQKPEECEIMKKIDFQIDGVPTGIEAIDKKIGGWQKSDLIVIGSRPGMGTTAFASRIAYNAVIDYQRPVAFFSLELSTQDLVKRFYIMEKGIEHKVDLTDSNKTENVVSFTKVPLFIDDTPDLTVVELQEKCRKLKQQHAIQLIIIDYLQLMTGDREYTGTTTEKKEQEISDITRSLKELAKELDISVIVLSQLNRSVDMKSKRPQLSDLPDSSSIEQNADMVLFIYRPEYYRLEFEDGTPSAGLADIMIAKNCRGATDNIRIGFQYQCNIWGLHDDIERFRKVEKNGKWGINVYGKIILPCEYDKIVVCDEEEDVILSLKKDNKWSIINLNLMV